MRILTLNAWGTYGPAQRRPVLAAAIRSLDADILCLQEATDSSLLDELNYPKRLRAPMSGLAILSRLPVVEQRTITYQAVSPLESEPRQALIAEVKSKNSLFWIVTTHLAWKAEDESSRVAQVYELLEHLAPLKETVLLSGDFNADPGSEPIRRILNNGFVDLYAAANPADPGITWDNRNPFIQSHSVVFPDRRIDCLFLRGTTLKLDRCEVICKKPGPNGLYPSDHYGVLANFL